MSDLSELTRVRPDPDDLPELDLPGLHRRARRRDRLRVAATTTLAIAVLGAGVVGIDRLIAPFGGARGRDRPDGTRSDRRRHGPTG